MAESDTAVLILLSQLLDRTKSVTFSRSKVEGCWQMSITADMSHRNELLEMTHSLPENSKHSALTDQIEAGIRLMADRVVM